MVMARRQEWVRERVVRSRSIALIVSVPVVLVAFIFFIFVLAPASDNDDAGTDRSRNGIGAHSRSSAHGGLSGHAALSGGGVSIGGRSKHAIKMVVGSGNGGAEGEGDRYAVVIDAGKAESSSVHVYRFDSRIELGGIQGNFEVVESVKPGLASYHDDPKAAADSVRPLMKKALKAVPELTRPVTPILVRASATLRQLPGDMAYQILREIRLMLTEFPFPYSHDDVSTLEGGDEGCFAWTAVNFLLGNFGDRLGNHLGSTVAVVDLGDTSAQVAYAVPADVADKAPAGHVRRLSVMGTTYHVRVHSLQGYGLMAGRAAVLRASNDTQGHPCMHMGFKGRFEHNNELTAASARPAGGSAALCKALVLQHIRTVAVAAAATAAAASAAAAASDAPAVAGGVVDAGSAAAPEAGCFRGAGCLPAGVRSGGGRGEGALRVVITSYFPDRAQQFGLIPHNGTHNAATTAFIPAHDFARVAEEACATPLKEVTRNFPHVGTLDAPYVCLDANYLFHLLTSGLGVDPSAPLTPVKQIAYKGRGVRVAWPLGAAIDAANHAAIHAVF